MSYATSSLYHAEALSKGRASSKAYQNAIRAEVNRFSKVFFIVDGLDMFSDKERILSRLQKLPEHAQLLVTLREVSQVGNASYVSVLASPDDIHQYTHSRIQTDPGLEELFKDGIGPQLRQEIIHMVMEKSHGV